MEIAPHLSFPPFRLDTAGEQFWRDQEEIKLRRKTFEVLRYLVDHPGELVTKAILLDAIWGEVVVSDTMPAICVSELRKVLGDDAKAPRFIVTVRGRGYRFIAQITKASGFRSGSEVAVVAHCGSAACGTQARTRADWPMAHECHRRDPQCGLRLGRAGHRQDNFVRAFLASIAAKNQARIASGQCIEQYGAGEPYLPMLEALTRLCQEPGGAEVLAVLRQFAPNWLAQMPSLLDHSERERLREATQGVTQQRMLSEMTSALEALAAETPMVLLLEDLHWSDPQRWS